MKLAVVKPKAVAMPSDNGIRLNDKQKASPVVPDPGKQDPEGAIRRSEPRSSSRTLQDLDLVSQGEVLEDQLLAGAQAREAGVQE